MANHTLSTTSRRPHILIAAALSAFLLAACMQEPLPDQDPGGPDGQANVSLKLERIGVLHKRSDIEMETLYITLTATGEAPVLDTIPLSGNTQQSILKSYPGLASLKTWTLVALAKDQNGVTVYSGTTEFTIPPNGTANVPLILAPQFSMLRALFFPIRDSVTQVQLRVDGSLVASENFAKQTRIGDTVTLQHDYVSVSPSGTTHALRMDVRGDMWGMDTVLYRGDTGITMVSGKDTTYKLTLRWVGPSVPPPGQATITVTLGAVGTVRVDGYLEDTATAPVAYGWQAIGTAGYSGSIASYTSLALDAANYPVVAYADAAQGQKASVIRWNGTNWTSVGTTAFTQSYAVMISLAVNAQGNPVIAFRDGAAGDRLTVKRWDSDVELWVTVGIPGFSPGGVESVSLALDATGDPVVAFRDSQNGRRATVMRWKSATGWASVGTPGFSTGTADFTTLAIDRAGNPVVAFSDGTSGQATVMRHIAGAWHNYGTPRFSPGVASHISLALDSAGSPVVAFQDKANTNKACVMRMNGTMWQTVGSPGISQGTAEFNSLKLDAGGNPVIAFRDLGNGGKAAVRRWNGTSWADVGHASVSQSVAEFTSLALDAFGNPVLAFSDQANGWKAAVMRYGSLP